MPAQLLLPLIIAVPTIIVTLLWLAYLNFKSFRPGWPLWRRNLLGFAGAFVFVIVTTAALYNRVWEVFEPAEPAHGAAVLSLTQAPTLRNDVFNSLQVRFPDGRIWLNSLGYPFFDQQAGRWSWFWWSLVRPLPVSAGPQRFLVDSNWVSATTKHIDFWNPDGGGRQVKGFLDTVGVQTDGTLWISSEAKPFAWTGAKMIRFGDESNWWQVVRLNVGLLLLKRDGTLWHWGTNYLDWKAWQTKWPTVRASRPQPLGTNSDWQQLFNHWNRALVRKKDGSVWAIDSDWKAERATNFDQVVLQTFSESGNNTMSYIGKNGTLWASSRYYFEKNGAERPRRILPVSPETNWVATATSWNWLTALKADGSLWQWRLYGKDPAEITKISPTPLGIHHDWIGLTGTWDGVMALAADGSLWFWPNPEYCEGSLFKTPKQPQPLGNIFGKAD